jgi:hypothetical protein
MRLSSILNLSLIAIGAAASVPVLRRRDAWEKSNRRAFIVLDYDDALSVTTRAGMPQAEFFKKAAEHGATHLSLPELTLNRLIAKGRVVVTVPAAPVMSAAGSGGWRYLSSPDSALLEHIALELAARVPGSQPQLLAGEAAPTLAIMGDLPTLAEMGLGFEASAAAAIVEAGLGIVPRPVSFAWPEARLVQRTLEQAAALAGTGPGPRIVAFEGDLILGHEMHLDATVAALVRFGLTFAYFSETRHQKGDWFIAKRLAPAGQVVLSHCFTPAAMVPEDFHSAAHHWGMLARARSIRL